jgi:hypothetical protein
MAPGCIGKSNTHNLPAPTDLTENPYAEKNYFCFGVSQKAARVVERGIELEFQPRKPIFENVLIFEKNYRPRYSTRL